MSTVTACNKVGKEIRAAFDGINKGRQDLTARKANMPETIMEIARKHKVGVGKAAESDAEMIAKAAGWTSNTAADQQRRREVTVYCNANVYRAYDGDNGIKAMLEATKKSIDSKLRRKIDTARITMCQAIANGAEPSIDLAKQSWTARAKTWEQCLDDAANKVLSAIAPAGFNVPTKKDDKAAAARELVPQLAQLLHRYAPASAVATAEPTTEPTAEPVPANLTDMLGKILQELQTH